MNRVISPNELRLVAENMINHCRRKIEVLVGLKGPINDFISDAALQGEGWTASKGQLSDHEFVIKGAIAAYHSMLEDAHKLLDVIGDEVLVLDEAFMRSTVDNATLRINELNNQITQWREINSHVPNGFFDGARLILLNQELIEDFVYLRSRVERRLEKLDQIDIATRTMFREGYGIFADVNIGTAEIKGAWNGTDFSRIAVTTWRSNLQRAWNEVDRGRILNEIEEQMLTRNLWANRYNPEFANWSDERFEAFVRWELENLRLVREMYPLLKYDCQDTFLENLARTNFMDLIFLTDFRAFEGIAVEDRKAILEHLNASEDGILCLDFLRSIEGQDGSDAALMVRAGLIGVAYRSSEWGRTVADLETGLLKADMMRIGAMGVFGLYIGMRSAQIPGLKWNKRSPRISSPPRKLSYRGRTYTIRLSRGTNVTGFRIGGTGGTPPRIPNNQLIETATTPGRGGVTPVGRAFQKHSNRGGSFTGNASGNAASNTQQGRQHLERIINNPNSTHTIRSTKAHGDVLDIRLPDGTGVRFSADGSRFIGFLEPFTPGP